MGPEGLGDKNDAESDAEEAEDEDEDEDSELVRGPVAEKTILSNHAVNVVSALAAVARDCLTQPSESKIISNVHAVIRSLQDPEPEPELQLETSSEGVGFLATLAKRCQKAEVFEACAHLKYWMGVLTFACQMNRYPFFSTSVAFC